MKNPFNTILFITIFSLSNVFLYAQEKRLKFISVEAGGDIVSTSPNDHNYIRGEMVNYYNGALTSNLKASMYRGYVGVRAEIFSRNNKFSISSGIRFSYIKSSIGKDHTWNSTSDIFYFLDKQSETDIAYFKIRSISQSSNYIGVPIDLRVYPFKRRLFMVYFKLGIELNYKISSNTTVSFKDKIMNQFNDDVASKFGKPQPLSVVGNTGAGIQLGRPNKTNLRFEIGPSVYTERTSSIVKINAGFGAQINVVIPF